MNKIQLLVIAIAVMYSISGPAQAVETIEYGQAFQCYTWEDSYDCGLRALRTEILHEPNNFSL